MPNKSTKTFTWSLDLDNICPVYKTINKRCLLYYYFFVSVGITAYLNGGTVSKETILTPSTKYGNVHGTGNLPGGQFTCRVPGMYIVMVTIVSNAFHAQFDIYKNSDIIAEGYVAEHPNQSEHDYFHSGTADTTIQLNTNDRISARAGKTMLVGDKSSISIVKIG